mmetsp:Transcript_31956/g.76378  ORF Transcript_31956/g.76378 Transcript_31956/m.76378 type:complete len:211 (+) Transcript_31956:1002-1634(+)
MQKSISRNCSARSTARTSFLLATTTLQTTTWSLSRRAASVSARSSPVTPPAHNPPPPLTEQHPTTTRREDFWPRTQPTARCRPAPQTSLQATRRVRAQRWGWWRCWRGAWGARRATSWWATSCSSTSAPARCCTACRPRSSPATRTCSRPPRRSPSASRPAGRPRSRTRRSRRTGPATCWSSTMTLCTPGGPSPSSPTADTLLILHLPPS